MTEDEACDAVEKLKEGLIVDLVNIEDVVRIELMSCLSGVDVCHTLGTAGTKYDGKYIITRMPRLAGVKSR